MLSSFGGGGLQQSCWQISSQQSCPQPCHLPGQTQATHMRSAVGRLRGIAAWGGKSEQPSGEPEGAWMWAETTHLSLRSH